MIFKRPDTSSSTPSHSSEDCSSSLKRAVALHYEGNKPPKKRQALERSRVSAVYHVNSYVATYSYSINLAIYVIDGITDHINTDCQGSTADSCIIRHPARI